jgi:aquaporin Z
MRSDAQCTPAEAVAIFKAQLLREPAAHQPQPIWIGRAGKALSTHWPEYLCEGICLGTFMISACFFAVLLRHPASPVRRSVESAGLRHLLGGLAMGLTAITIIYSRLGMRSGAHMNPVVTLTFYRLKKVMGWDAIFYVMSQFAGGVAGTALAFVLLRMALAHRDVNFAVTQPGARGEPVAFIAEAFISFLMMSVVLRFTNHPKLSRFTGIAAGVLVMLFITFEGQLSGMSMNPARSFGTATVSTEWYGLWIYFTAPLLGMMAAAEMFVRTKGTHAVICAKLNHSGTARCIFRCGYARQQASARAISAHGSSHRVPLPQSMG